MKSTAMRLDKRRRWQGRGYGFEILYKRQPAERLGYAERRAGSIIS